MITEKFNKIYEETYDYILKYVLAKCDNISNVEDIMQNIYVKFYIIMEKDSTYIYNQKFFLIKLAKNELFKYYSLKNKLKILMTRSIGNNEEETSIIDNIKDEKLNIEDSFFLKYDIDLIWKEVCKEDLISQKIMSLYFLNDLKLSEIAKLLELNESSVKTKLYRAIKRIKSRLSGVVK
jgi:RNA polymerase sigma factor, sigma-70 family